MKKISLKNINENLSRKEMRSIKGGSGSGGYSAECGDICYPERTCSDSCKETTACKSDGAVKCPPLS